MYFPNAFKKSFLIGSNSYSGSAVTLAANTAKTSDLLPGQIGFYSGTNYGVGTALGTSPTVQAAPFYVAQGSWYKTSASVTAADKIGVHGGYQESVKSKIINPKYISRVIKVSAKTAKNHIVQVDPQNGASNALYLDTTYRLRLDIKGSPALRFLNHQIYRNIDAYSGVGSSSTSVDPNVVLLQWKDAINSYPTIKDFVLAKVWNNNGLNTTATATASSSLTVASAGSGATAIAAGQKVIFTTSGGAYTVAYVGSGYVSGVTVPLVDAQGVSITALTTTSVTVKFYNSISTSSYTVLTSNITTIDAHLELTGAYTDSTFQACTFTPTDYYNVEPVFIYASVVDESGNPANAGSVGSLGWIDSFDSLDNISSTVEKYHVQRPVQVSGTGEMVIRDMILDGRYRQEAFPDSSRVESLRMREIEQNPVLNNITRSALYNQVLILHNVPRWNNPSGMFDNDQYLVQFYVPSTVTDVTKITDFIVGSANAAQGTSVITLEQF